MALIKCPDCGKEYSDTATACPNCGYKKRSKKKCIIISSCFALIIIVAVFLVFYLKNNETANVDSIQEQAIENTESSEAFLKKRAQYSVVETAIEELRSDLVNPQSLKIEDVIVSVEDYDASVDDVYWDRVCVYIKYDAQNNAGNTMIETCYYDTHCGADGTPFLNEDNIGAYESALKVVNAKGENYIDEGDGIFHLSKEEFVEKDVFRVDLDDYSSEGYVIY